MKLINHWRHPGCGAHATVYLGNGLVAVPAKYGARVTLWDVNELASPRLVTELTDRPDCQAAALCNGHLLLGSDRGIESMRFSRDGLEPVDCSPFDPQINDFDVAGDTALAVSKENSIKAVRVDSDGRLLEIGWRRNVLARCHGASHEGRLVGVIGFRGEKVVERPLGLFPEAIDDDGRFTDPATWVMANDGGPESRSLAISNRICLHGQHAYVATAIKKVSAGEKSWSVGPAVVVLDIADPSHPQILANYPCIGSTTCTGLILDRERKCLIAGSGTIVRRFDIEGDLLHETESLTLPYGELGDGYIDKPPSIHDVCKTDLTHDDLPVFVAGGQQHDDLYLFTA